MINTDKPTTSLTNTARVSFAELLSTIDTTWATETRTWAECASLMANTLKQTTEYLATQALDYLTTEDSDYLITGVGLITNTPKP